MTKAGVLYVSTADLRGGAERAALDLHLGALRNGFRSSVCVGTKKGTLDSVWELPNDTYRSGWARAWLRLTRNLPAASSGPGRLAKGLQWVGQPSRWRAIHRGNEDMDFPASGRVLELAPFRPDLVHLHNLHGGYFDLRVLPHISRLVPTVLTLHDAWMLSGHCAHSFDCDRWKTGCGSCPDLTIYPAILRDGTADNWQRKKEVYERSRLYVSAPSRWLMSKTESSILARGTAESRVIPYGVDLDVFRPGPMDLSRKVIGLPTDARVMLFVGTTLTTNQFKDFGSLREALGGLPSREERMILVCIGESRPSMKIGNTEVRFVGWVDDPSHLAHFYRATDIYVHPARADSFPYAVIEAQACGRPVVASRVGGIPEQVVDDPSADRTGLLVPSGDSSALARAIAAMLDDQALAVRMGDNAARHATENFGLSRYVADYIGWYEEILERGSADSFSR